MSSNPGAGTIGATSKAASNSASLDAHSISNGQGEFHPSIPRDEPMTTKGATGKKVSEADHAPEFSAQTLPPGSAPASNTFKPDPIGETPGQADNDIAGRQHGKESTMTSAVDSLPGATSRDVHAGLGHPGQGQTSHELRHDGKHTNKSQGQGNVDHKMGGSGLRENVSHAKRGLEDERAPGEKGLPSAREHNVSMDGATDKYEPARDVDIAAETR